MSCCRRSSVSEDFYPDDERTLTSERVQPSDIMVTMPAAQETASPFKQSLSKIKIQS